MLSLLLHAQDIDGTRMTDRQLRDEAMTLFIAGHETTALALSWTWYLLSQHPDVEAKLWAELEAVLGGHPPSSSRYFPDPEAFMPDRWADGLAKRLPKYAYFPFGGGPRICIGGGFAMMEAVLLLATMAQRFRLTLVPGHPIALYPSITLRPAYGVRVTLERRR